jgi:hypothetical protein
MWMTKSRSQNLPLGQPIRWSCWHFREARVKFKNIDLRTEANFACYCTHIQRYVAVLIVLNLPKSCLQLSLASYSDSIQ